MAGLCEGGNEPPGSLKAICNDDFDHNDYIDDSDVNDVHHDYENEDCDDNNNGYTTLDEDASTDDNVNNDDNAGDDSVMMTLMITM
ncbi:hypothetical protein ANN_08178 [Periplaneta americana]|uniref:Uncharacterized protein n=1 Tax=Periplaneta americana TaxID=6978 RepID=A0ABQ8T288_PERAM|nr:hypothetical protein ANN_08178 [Periplaneta americana]